MAGRGTVCVCRVGAQGLRPECKDQEYFRKIDPYNDKVLAFSTDLREYVGLSNITSAKEGSKLRRLLNSRAARSICMVTWHNDVAVI